MILEIQQISLSLGRRISFERGTRLRVGRPGLYYRQGGDFFLATAFRLGLEPTQFSTQEVPEGFSKEETDHWWT